MLKRYKKNDLDLIRKLNEGVINTSEYLAKRGINRTGDMPELIPIANKNPLLFNSFMAKMPVGIRIISMKEILNITNEEIAINTGYSKTLIGDFIRENSIALKNDKMLKHRNFSIELYHDLSIILDIPHRYFDQQAEYTLETSFVEYDRKSIEVKTLSGVIKEIITNALDGNPGRKIFGVKIENQFFKNENKYLNTRVDVCEKYFSIELHLQNEASLNFNEIKKIKDLLNVRNDIFIRKSFLRSNYKVYIVINTDTNGSIPSDVFHLNDEFLWKEVLSNVCVPLDENILSREEKDSLNEMGIKLTNN